MSTESQAHALKDERTWPFFLDAIVLGGVIAVVYLMVIVGRYWFGAIVPSGNDIALALGDSRCTRCIRWCA